MMLFELIKGLDARCIGSDTEVKGLCFDSRNIRQGDLFFALKGQRHHGIEFVDDAISRGACAVVTDREIKGLNVPVVIVKDTLEAMAYISNKFYGEPSKKHKVIGITGTNGKTTTAWLIYNILKYAGWRVSLLGTIVYLMPDGTKQKASLTTPQSIQWQELLSESVKKGAQATVAEISSHGLALKRVDWTEFAVSVFTNLSRDHLDFHKDMQQYFEAKARLFRILTKGPWVINLDDPYGNILANEAGERLVSYSLEQKAMFKAVQWDLNLDGITVWINEGSNSWCIRSPLIGKTNVYNIVAAVAVARTLQLSWDVIVDAIANTYPVNGRLQKVDNPIGLNIIIDYAHTPDALQKTLESLKPLTKGRLITVFGCGGNRDKGKRPLMGKFASEMSDLVVITSDNPRWEDADEIIKDILGGIKSNNYKVIPDRRKAIYEAITEASPGDTILIAGKGHEDYQEIKGKRYHFSDYEVVRQVLQEKAITKDTGGNSV